MGTKKKILKYLGFAFLFMIAMIVFVILVMCVWGAIFHLGEGSGSEITTAFLILSCENFVFFFCIGLVVYQLHEIKKAIHKEDHADPDTLFIDRDQDPKGD